jgi:hypothetical protein
LLLMYTLSGRRLPCREDSSAAISASSSSCMAEKKREDVGERDEQSAR